MLSPTVVAKQSEYWQKASGRDWKTARYLFEGNRYDACLFFCHLTLEKLLKGVVVVKTKSAAPPIHDLAKLAEHAGLEVNGPRILRLREFTTFNIAGRYDDEKFSFYKVSTPAFTAKKLDECKELLQWLKKNYPKK